MVYKFFDKKSIGSGINSSLILATELHKPVIKDLIKEKYIRNLNIIYGE